MTMRFDIATLNSGSLGRDTLQRQMLLFSWFLVSFCSSVCESTSYIFIQAPDSPPFSLPQLPELYASVEDFIKESKKSNLPKTHSISPSKAQKMLSQNLNAMSISGTDDVREEDPQPLFVCEVVRREGEKPDSVTEILYRSLLTPSLSLVERLTKSQQRLFRHGVPPPAHTFPYEILIEHSKSSSPVPVPVKEKTPGANTLGMLGISRITPENFVFADRIAKYFLVDPGNLNR